MKIRYKANLSFMYKCSLVFFGNISAISSPSSSCIVPTSDKTSNTVHMTNTATYNSNNLKNNGNLTFAKCYYVYEKSIIEYYYTKNLSLNSSLQNTKRRTALTLTEVLTSHFP